MNIQGSQIQAGLASTVPDEINAGKSQEVQPITEARSHFKSDTSIPESSEFHGLNTLSNRGVQSVQALGRFSGSDQTKQKKLLELLADKIEEPQCVKTELEQLAQQLNKLHVNASLMDEVDRLNLHIETFVNGTQDSIAARQEIANHIQELASHLAIWAGVNKENMDVLTYLIRQGVSIRQNDLYYFEDKPESTVCLPFNTMKELVDNCFPASPDLVFVKAIFADTDPRFDELAEKILTHTQMNETLFQAAIAQAIPKAPLSRLTVLFRYLSQQHSAIKNSSRCMMKELERHSYKNHRVTNIGELNRYPNSMIMVFTLESIAQKSREEAYRLLGSFSENELHLITVSALLGGLHQSVELLNEMGVTVTRQMFEKASVSIANSPFLMAKEAGLTNERLFVETINKAAPFLWTLPNKYGKQLFQRFPPDDKKVLSFINLVREQMSASGQGGVSQKWPEPQRRKLSLPDVDLWAASIFAVNGNQDLLNSTRLLERNDRSGQAWNTLVCKAKQCNGLASPDDFMQFMDWFLMEGQSCIRGEYHEAELDFSPRQKSYRPDLWLDSGVETSSGSSGNDEEFIRYVRNITNLHFDIIESFLHLAPPSHRIHVLNNWLNNPDCSRQRAALFPKPIHPFNYMESPNIWQLLLSVAKDYQPQPNPLDKDWENLGGPNQWTAPPPLESFKGEVVEVFGRSLAIQQKGGNFDYLKLLSDTEKVEDLAKEGDKINLMSTIASQYALQSSIPRVAGKYGWDNLQGDLDAIVTPAQKARLEEKCRYLDDGVGYSLHLFSKKDAPYHRYSYDLDPETQANQIFDGLLKYSHDCGVLFSHGLYAPNVMAADHDSVTRRKHHILSSYLGAPVEGRLLQWKKASEHPNVGPVGLRDSGDTKSMAELGEDYFFSSRDQVFLDFEKTEDRAKVALSELAKNAQGLVLQYALCFQKQFDIDNEESTQHHENKIKIILNTLFLKAFPELSGQNIQEAMDEDGLLSQAVREVVYWCDHDAKFIDDIKQNIIPKSIYQTSPETANIVNLNPTLCRELQPGIGLVTRDNQPNLGISFGANPLVTLNAVIVKLLAKGALSSVNSASDG